jgi:hypothetical protein
LHAALHERRRLHDVNEGISMNKLDAEKMNRHLESMIEQANHVLLIANNSGDEETKLRTQKVLGAVVTELDFELMEPIYKKFPELRPSDL